MESWAVGLNKRLLAKMLISLLLLLGFLDISYGIYKQFLVPGRGCGIVTEVRSTNELNKQEECTLIELQNQMSIGTLRSPKNKGKKGRSREAGQ